MSAHQVAANAIRQTHGFFKVHFARFVKAHSFRQTFLRHIHVKGLRFHGHHGHASTLNGDTVAKLDIRKVECGRMHG